MSNSLQDQLLKAGLTDKKKAKQTAKEKHKQNKAQNKSKTAVVDETKLAASEAKQKKVERDRALNAEREAEAQKKAIDAQIKQLINSHKQDRGKGDISFSFKDGTTIKKLVISAEVHKKLLAGVFAIARVDSQYFIVPEVIATKISERDGGKGAGWIVHQAQKDPEQVDADDPYADYQIPDDLMW